MGTITQPQKRNQMTPKPYALFIGHQETPKGPIPLFNIIGGKRDKSTVTLKTLRELGIRIKKERSS